MRKLQRNKKTAFFLELSLTTRRIWGLAFYYSANHPSRDGYIWHPVEDASLPITYESIVLLFENPPLKEYREGHETRFARQY
jgi:hypothetical protein